MIQNKVLILDDEAEICNILTEFLSINNYTVKCCNHVDEFLKSILEFEPQFLLIDKNVHQSDTYPLIDRIRKTTKTKDIPIIVLTGMNEEGEQERAVDVGADDILFKPLCFSEMRAKLKALSRRANVYVGDKGSLSYMDINLALESSEAFIRDTKIDLTATEFKILKSLMLSKGNVLSRDQLHHKALTLRNNSPRTIDVHINSLRNKLGEFGGQIKTLRGRGYILT